MFKMKPVFRGGIFYMMFVLNDTFAVTSARYTIKFTEPRWNWDL